MATRRVGDQDQTLVWIRSYLSYKLQKVNIKKTLSQELLLKLKVLVFHMDLFFGIFSTICASSYADDTQLYIAIEKKYSFTDRLSDIESYVSEIKLWTEHNMLELNDDKT